ncbi:hypothetical protein [Tomitella gaofuii]|uniref:hypothetical protein n=1 Tax=Tomitella gaofuii TaxID=2760083 RepID=UPI0015FAC1C4|nr:hypothetical protein [Tomitella gaofuii]
MERGSDKHGARADDELQEEVEPMIRSSRPAHAEEWRQPEPPADDDPDVRPFHPGNSDDDAQ